MKRDLCTTFTVQSSYSPSSVPPRRFPAILVPWINPLDAKDRAGATPLCLAAAAGHVDVVAAFLRAGASAGLADAEGNTPLMHAVRNGHELTALVLLASTVGTLLF